MKSALKLSVLPAIAAAAFLAPAPAAAMGPAERAVAQCRTEALGQFGAGEVRSHRIGAIAGNSRSTRVTIYVTADRRYTFECAADAGGRIVTAAFNPARPSGQQLAAGQR
ncbi:MAG TPA: hypothetical protein VLK25_09220 [Allosphingosinicella sp.]|nr:hypothetical protein [Allosphingosinicella sp.]